MMFVVGVTGGIGSGKTAATDHFSRLGIDIVDADIAARVVVEPGKPALNAIAAHFGDDILLADGQLNRAALRQRIFSDPEEKQWLEALLHPLIAEEISRSLQQAQSPYVIFVSPLMVESGQSKLCDRILVIDAPETLQVDRTVARDNNDRAQIERIIASQAPRQLRLDQADDIIVNNGSIRHLQTQVEKLHHQYLRMAREKAQNLTMSDSEKKCRVKCPACKTPVIWSQDNPHRPFCSERCRNLDFVAWANEENIVPGNSLYDDLLSDDLADDQ